METNNEIKISGRVRLQVFDGDKCIQDTGFGDNIITTLGKASIAGLTGDTGSITAFTYLAVGTSTQAADAADTALIAEISTLGLSRSSATVSRTTTTTTNDTLRLTKTWSVTGSTTVNEIGILNASSSGTLLARKVVTAVAVINGNTLTATYDIKFT